MKKNINLEETFAANKDEDKLLRHAKRFLPQIHKSKGGVSINFIQENNVIEKEDLSITIHAREIPSHPPFLISLNINHLSLHNCTLNSGASVNIMTLHFVKKFGLNIT
jgi:hypothetical protein